MSSRSICDGRLSPNKRFQARLDDVVGRQGEATCLSDALTAAREFHLMMAELSGSQRVHAALSGLVDEVRRLHYLLPNVEDHITSSEELSAHQQIVEAVRLKDATAARQLMVSHLNEVADILVRGFSGM